MNVPKCGNGDGRGQGEDRKAEGEVPPAVMVKDKGVEIARVGE